MGGSSWSLVCKGRGSCAPCGVVRNDSSGPDTVACGIAGNEFSGPDTVACGIAGNDSIGPDTVDACGLAGNDSSGPDTVDACGLVGNEFSGRDTVDACSGAGTATCSVHADRQTRAVTTTMQAALNVRWRVPLIVSVSPEPRIGVERHPCQGPFASP